MFWHKRKVEHRMLALFPGAIPPTPASFASIARDGGHFEVLSTGPGWKAKATHPSFGAVQIRCSRPDEALPRFFTEFDIRLSDEDKALAKSLKSSVRVELEDPAGDVLRDRKRLWRGVRALIGEGIGAAFDPYQLRLIPTAMLDEELAHDAPLDLDSLYNVHLVDAGGRLWAHTHGLAELGGKDFDFLEPGLSGMQWDLTHALAFFLLENPDAKTAAAVSSSKPLDLVDVSEFTARAASHWRKLRETDEGHHEQRVIVCEPGDAKGFFARLTGRAGPVPSALIRRGLPDNVTLKYSVSTSQLLAERAQQTWPVLKRLREEFEGLPLKFLAKIAFDTTSGSREHLWFDVHGVQDGQIDGTLINSPHDVPSLQDGQRCPCPVERLSDWMILTPAGHIRPRYQGAARIIREHRAELEAALSA